MDNEELTSLMDQSIPKYAINCFNYAGYDTPQVVAQMKTSGDNNNLDEMESFILKYYWNDPACFPATITQRWHNGSSEVRPEFVFPPGHRKRIVYFIDAVKTKCFKCGNKRPHTVSAGSNKKSCPTQDGDGDTDVQSYNLKEISDDVRRRIVSWQNKLQDSSEVKQLKEFTHYNMTVKLDSTETPSVTIHCELCNKPYKLARRSGKNTMILSNWTGHIKECIISKQQKSTANAVETSMKIPKIKQQTLSGFIKRQKSVDRQVIQSQSDSKSNRR